MAGNNHIHGQRNLHACMRVVIQIQSFRRKPKKLKYYSAVTNRGQRKFKHFTTASEIKSYQEHLQNHKLQEMITQCACNIPAS